MTETMIYTGELTIVSCWCGIQHAIPSDLRTKQLRDAQSGTRFLVYCPLGHNYYPTTADGPTKAQREREWRLASDARAEALRDQLAAEKRQHAATKGKLTKMRKRIAAGVCPCCTRSFKQVRQHMERMHPDEAAFVFDRPPES